MLAVLGHLQDRGNLQLPCEFGIGHIIEKVTEITRALRTEEEIGVPAMSTIEERCLVNDFNACVHLLVCQPRLHR